MSTATSDRRRRLATRGGLAGVVTRVGLAGVVLVLAACSEDGGATPEPSQAPQAGVIAGAAAAAAPSGAGSGGMMQAVAGAGGMTQAAAGSAAEPVAASGAAASGGAMAAGSGGSAGVPMDSAGSGGTGGMAMGPLAGEPEPSGGCTRELLSATIDSYYAALAAHDASALPLSDGVKLTENGEVLELGQGLWENAGAVVYKHSALDTELCMSVSESVVPESGVDTPVGLRLKLEDGMLSEVETIVAREGDYVIFGSPFASDTDATIASASLGWEDAPPEAQRATREELAGWVRTYLEAWPEGGCDLAPDCKRQENGGGSFDCSFGASCSGASEGSQGLPARLVVADDVRGIAVGFTMFMGHTDMHMILMRGGQVQAVHAVLSAADSSGWD